MNELNHLRNNATKVQCFIILYNKKWEKLPNL